MRSGSNLYAIDLKMDVAHLPDVEVKQRARASRVHPPLAFLEIGPYSVYIISPQSNYSIDVRSQNKRKTMFANFSFGPSSSTPHRPQSLDYNYPPPSHDASRNDSLSPNSSRRTSPSPFRTPARQECSHTRPTSRILLSMSELSQKLGAHTIHGNRALQPRQHHPKPRRHASGTPTPSPPPAADDETFFEVETPSSRSPPSSSGCRRRQRQLHARMQCDPQHLKALADLVEGMVQAGSQCFVYEASGLASPREGGAGSSTSLASSEGEEDGDEAEEEEEEDGAAGSRPGCRRNETSTRRVARRGSVEWSGARTCVAKSVRVRKDVSRRGSAQVRRPER